MTTFNLTPNELKVAMILVNVCLNGMGGERPSDLEDDEYTWVAPEDLQAYGYSRHEAAGYWSSLNEKGFIDLDVEGDCVATAGWRYIDTIWDANQHLLQDS